MPEMKETQLSDVCAVDDGEAVIVETEEPEEPQGPPIDRGWAWVIVIGCFLQTFLVIGCKRTFGIFYVEFIQTFQASASLTASLTAVQSWTYSIASLLALTAGASLTSNRKIVIVGGLLSGLGYFLSSFAPNIEFMLFSLGVMSGLGFAFCYGPSLVMVGKYFDKRRGLANSMVACGGSLASLVLPMLIRYLSDIYGVRGTLMIVGGMLLNNVVVGLLLRPLDSWKKRKPGTRKKTKSKDRVIPECDETTQPDQKLLHRNNPSKTVVCNTESSPNSSAAPMSPLLQNQVPGSPKWQVTRDGSHRSIAEIVETMSNSNLAKFVSSNEDLVWSSMEESRWRRTRHQQKPEQPKPEKKCTFCFLGPSQRSKICETFSHTIDCSVMRNPLCIIFLIMAFFGSPGCSQIGNFIPPFASDVGIDNQRIALLVTIVGASDVVGRLLCGFISDRAFIKHHYLISVGVIVTAVASFLTPLYTEYWHFAVFSAVYGAFGGIYFALFPVLIVDFLGLENLSRMMGLYTLCYGISVGSTVPIIGALRDSLGSYVPAFYLLGAYLMISGSVLFFEPLARRWEEKRKLKHSEIECEITLREMPDQKS